MDEQEIEEMINQRLAHADAEPLYIDHVDVAKVIKRLLILGGSANYTSIALCSSISKLLDGVVIDKWTGRLITSDLQLGLKQGHSTVQWSSAMYSKAFDKVRYRPLFKLLITRDVPVLVIRLLFDSYKRQTGAMCDLPLSPS
jgi:hypothetical protein